MCPLLDTTELEHQAGFSKPGFWTTSNPGRIHDPNLMVKNRVRKLERQCSSAWNQYKYTNNPNGPVSSPRQTEPYHSRFFWFLNVSICSSLCLMYLNMLRHRHLEYMSRLCCGTCLLEWPRCRVQVLVMETACKGEAWSEGCKNNWR